MIKEEYESPYVVYWRAGHMYFHDTLLYQDATANLVVNKQVL